MLHTSLVLVKCLRRKNTNTTMIRWLPFCIGAYVGSMDLNSTNVTNTQQRKESKVTKSRSYVIERKKLINVAVPGDHNLKVKEIGKLKSKLTFRMRLPECGRRSSYYCPNYDRQVGMYTIEPKNIHQGNWNKSYRLIASAVYIAWLCKYFENGATCLRLYELTNNSDISRFAVENPEPSRRNDNINNKITLH